MPSRNPYEEILSAPAASRNEVSASLYNEWYAERFDRSVGAHPSKRKRKKLALYRAIIGQGHDAILEIGFGEGDLVYSLAGHAKRIEAIDISTTALELAKARETLWSLTEEQLKSIQFRVTSAVQPDFPDETFDWVISSSVIEHLHPDDVHIHLREVLRILKPGGNYLMWCPNDLGHHGDRDQHLTMLSYAGWIDRLAKAGFQRFRSPLTSRLPLVDARWKVFLERTLAALRIKILWSHLGVRNVLLVASR